jgi:ATP-dependent helicase/nuclease subunit A
VLGLDADEDGSGVAALCADDAFDVASVRRCMAANAAWGTKTGIDAANMMGDWLAANPQARLAGIDDFAKLFLTAKGEAKSARNLDKHEPAYADYQARVIAGIAALRDRIALVNLAALLDPALTVGRRFALAWEAAKAREGFIDFDDQIRAAAALLTERTTADWIRYKLDRRFDHVLVDEAQDTNEAQWRIVLDGLVQDFFSGQGQSQRDPRTLFVVGTTSRRSSASGHQPGKLCQGARAGAARTGGPGRGDGRAGARTALARPGQSYRTAMPILAFVDRAIAAIGPDRLACPRRPSRMWRHAPRPGAAVAPGRRSFG